MEHIDNRRFRRVKGVFKVNAERETGFVIDWSCDSRDISEGGIGLVESREPIVGSKIEVSFTLPGSSHRLSIQSKVIWIRPSEIHKGMFESGVEFLVLSSADLEALFYKALVVF